MRANDPRAAVVDDICEVFGGQPVVDRHQHRADLRHGVERFELSVRVRRDIGHPVAGRDIQLLQGVRPAVATIKELRIAEP